MNKRHHTQPYKKGAHIISQDRIYLSFTDQQTVLTSIGKQAICMDTSPKLIHSLFFKTYPPSALVVEKAIEHIENHLEQIHLPQTDDDVVCQDVWLAQVAIFAGASPILTRQALELAFNRIADIVSGSPKRFNEFPDTPEFLTTLIFIRECMHHLKIPRIKITHPI